jgi:hypothetical protein
MKSALLVVPVLALVLLIGTDAVHSSGDKFKEIEIKGYITEVNSPSSFEIDDYKVTLDGKYDVELQNVEDKALKFDPRIHIRVGTLVKVKCRVNPETLEAKVEEIKVDVKQFRRLSHTTVLDSSPNNLERDDSGKWTGEILADARRVMITPQTDVRFKLNKSEEREAKEKKKELEEQEEAAKEKEKEEAKAVKKAEAKKDDKLDNKSEDDSFDEEESVDELRIGSKPLQSLADITPGVYMTYKGVENLDGSLIASDVVFVKNEKTKQEKEVWQKLRIKEKESKKTNSFDMMKIAGEKFKVLPEDGIQEYVNNLGRSLVPEYQKNLPDDDENKIPFRFVVIYEKDINAGAYATGTIVIHHDVFNYIENEAQLAFLLSHEIAHATQEHQVRALNNKKKTRTWLKVGAIASYAMGYGMLARTFAMTEQAMRVGYQRSVENQADRIGMATMIQYGYDPREAPRLWKISGMIYGDDKTDFFWSDHSSRSERRSYLMLTLRNTYPGLDYSALKKDSPEFERIAAMIREKYPSKRKRRA